MSMPKCDGIFMSLDHLDRFNFSFQIKFMFLVYLVDINISLVVFLWLQRKGRKCSGDEQDDNY